MEFLYIGPPSWKNGHRLWRDDDGKGGKWSSVGVRKLEKQPASHVLHAFSETISGDMHHDFL
jgi:hypothetical protein